MESRRSVRSGKINDGIGGRTGCGISEGFRGSGEVGFVATD